MSTPPAPKALRRPSAPQLGRGGAAVQQRGLLHTAPGAHRPTRPRVARLQQLQVRLLLRLRHLMEQWSGLK